MKNFINYFFCEIALIAIFNPFPILSDDFPFEYERLLVNFNGVTNNNKSILAYGDGAIILRSIDNGNNWEQIKIADDSLRIKKIININSNYYGILNFNNVIKSSDNGFNWKLINSEENVEIYDISGNDDNIFILNNNKILKYNNDLEFISSLKIDSLNSSGEILLLNNSIYLPSDSGRIIIINSENFELEKIIDFKSLGLCTKCNNPTGIISERENLFIKTDDGIFKSSDYGNQWKLMYDKPSTFYVNNDSIYLLNTENNRIALFKIDNKKLVRISNDNIERNTMLLFPKGLKFISRDTLIVVGQGKYITMSYNGGIEWNLISNINMLSTGGRNIFVNGLLNFYATNEGQIFKTANGGISFKPQKYNESINTKNLNPEVIYFDTTSKGFIFSNKIDYKSENLFFTNDYGETFQAKTLKLLTIHRYTDGKINIVRNDSVYYIFMSGKSSPPNNGRFYTVIFILDSLFNYQYNDSLSTFDSLMRIDSLWIEEIKHIKNSKKLIGLGLDKRYPYNSNDAIKVYYIIYSDDFGMTWTKDIQLNMNDTILSQINLFDDYILIGGIYINSNSPNYYQNVLFKIDLKTKKYESILFDKTSDLNNFIEYNNKIYCGGVGYLWCNNDIKNEPRNWFKIPIENFYVRSMINLDNIIYAGMSRLPGYVSNSYKLTPKKLTTVEIPTQVPKPCFWTFPPYPQPASNNVKIHIYWDRRYDIDDAGYMVYDIMGNKIEGSENISLSLTGSWDGELTWNCKNATDGVYFISIKYGDTSKAIPVIINN